MKSSKKPEVDLSNVPDRLRTTARTLLSLSGRTKLKEDEVKLLVLLLENHYTARINSEIEYRAERFKKMGRNKKSLTAFYIYEILKTQRNIVDDEPATAEPQAVTTPQTEAIYKRVVSPHRKSNKKTASAHLKPRAPVSEPVELAMPVVEAEKVIEEYDVEHNKPALTPAVPGPAIPAALEELFTKIQDREFEHGEEYINALPKDEYSDPMLPEDDGFGNMPLED